MKSLFITTALMMSVLCSYSQKVKAETEKSMLQTVKTITENKMRVEIWSDVICPYCYIGKRKFELALNQFEHKNKIEIIWKSYQLDPDMPLANSKSTYELISEKYGVSTERAKEMHERVSQIAKEVGLSYNFDIAKPANTLKAHQLTHFAKESGKQNEAEEALFRAYFTEGKNIGDLETLLHIGRSLGLDETALRSALERDLYEGVIKQEIEQGKQYGLSGVPFFVFNEKYAVSGAQESKVFADVLAKSYAEWRKDNPELKLEVIEGKVCTPDLHCD